MKVSLSLLLLDRVFLSLYLNEALSYKGILIGPELVHNVLVFSQDEGKVPGKEKPNVFSFPRRQVG